MAQLKLVSLNLGVHFSVCLLDGVTDKRKADYFSQMIQEEHTALLVPTALRTYYPFIAATSYIKVKPLVLVDLTLTLRPFLTPEMSSILMNMAAISDETIIEKLLAQDYTSAGVFGSTVAFDCLLGFENQSISSRNKLHVSRFVESVAVCSAAIVDKTVFLFKTHLALTIKYTLIQVCPQNNFIAILYLYCTPFYVLRSAKLVNLRLQ